MASTAVAVAALAAAAIAFDAAGTGSVAQAATVTYDPLAKALDFNTFVENETTLVSTESEGPMATGGDLVIKGSYNVDIHGEATYTVPGDARPTALVVGGRVDYSQDPATSVVQVLGDGYVKVGDLTGTTVRTTDDNNASVNTRLVASGAAYDSTPRIELTARQPEASVGPASPIDFADAFAEFRSQSQDLFVCRAHEVAMTDAAGAAVPKGGVAEGQQIRITLEQGVTNVLNVTGEDLNNMADFVFENQPNADTPLLINVDTGGTGGEFDWDVASQAGISGDQAPYILWNFKGTTRLNIASGDTVEGSILAPDADYSDVSPANVEGQIIAANANFGDVGESGGEVHYFPFAAQLACETDEPSPSETTDEPTTGDETSCEPTESPTDGTATPSEEPTTDEPTTEEPTTDGPTTDGPTTDAPTTNGPTTDAPTDDGSEPPAGGGTDAAGDGCPPLTTTGGSVGPMVIAAGVLIAVGGGVVALAAAKRKGARS
nr:collagen-binding domain-containing protein [Glycomyces amatae]